MAAALKLLRTSIHSFFCNYHTFTSLPTLLIFPSSAATLLSPSLLPSSSSSSSTLLLAASRRIHSLSAAGNLPLSPRLSAILTLKLSQTILCFLLSLPFTLTFLTLSQASIISAAAAAADELPRRRRRPSPPLSSILRLYPPLLLTRLFTTLTILAANVAAFSILLIASSVAGELGLLLSALAGIAYSTIIANVLVICNLAGVVSAMESCSGYAAVLKACVLIRGRAAEALTLSLCSNLAMAAVEALFQMRVVRIYGQKRIFFDLGLVFEASTIIYIYSVVRVLDIVVGFCFYRSCREELLGKCEGRFGGVEGEEKRDLKV